MHYFLEVWLKPKLFRSTLDELTMASEVLLVIVLACLLLYTIDWIGGKLSKKRRK